MPRTRLAVLGAVVALTTQSCGQELDCTLVGGANGVRVEIPSSLAVSAGDVTIEVCNTHGCSSTRHVLRKLPSDAPTPVGRGATATFHQLGQKFAPGQVMVTVSLHGPDGALVASREQSVTLSRSYPNGKSCDGDGYLSGSLRLDLHDRV